MHHQPSQHQSGIQLLQASNNSTMSSFILTELYGGAITVELPATYADVR